MARLLIAIAVMTLALVPFALAVQPDERLDDPVLESRARSLSAQLRCLVCQNQSIDDSDAELARDLRILVRERLVAGDSDQAVLDYVVDRYGEYVLLNPVLAPHTLALWVTPPVLFLIGLFAIVLAARRRSVHSAPLADDLSAGERARLNAILKGDD